MAVTVTRAVVPAAGHGTRLLPATRAVPKELLPIAGKPAIQRAAEEAARAGVNDMLVVTAPGRHAIEDHFCGLGGDLPVMHYVRQETPDGLGSAVLLAAAHVGGNPFAVLLADELVTSGLLARMISVRGRYGGSVVALMEAGPASMSAYGCAETGPADEEDVVKVRSLIEKPGPQDAPSAWAVIGRYVCDPAIFAVLRGTAPGHGGEVQLTDALSALAAPDAPGGGVRGVLFRGERHDIGTWPGRLQAEISFAGELGEAS
jgi:UTP--glucose-1-phosphate uridylyltransferase